METPINNRDPRLFEIYRPFRNKLAQFNVIDGLYLIWGYSRNYTFNMEFPNDIEKPPGFNPYEPNKHLRKHGKALYDHELEFFLREFILNCDITPKNKSLREYRNFIGFAKYMRDDLDNGVARLYTNPSNIILEIHRIAHRQFKWQVGYSLQTIFRYYKIYSHPVLSKIIQDKFKLTTHQLFLIGVYLFTLTGSNFQTRLPFSSNIKAITAEMIKIFIDHFSISIKEAKIELKKYHSINENFFYSYNPLLAKPFIINNSSLICPTPIFIFWLITNGLYYPLIEDEEIRKNFGNSFGPAFESYVGEVLQKSCKNSKFTILSEQKYFVERKERSSSDWIIHDNDSIMFIECKTKRLTMESKTALEINLSMEDDLKKLASGIIQLYKTYLDYKSNLYPNLKYNGDKHFFPVVLTLEDWFVSLNTQLMDRLKEIVKELFNDKGLDLDLLEKFPYHIKSATTLERDVQLIYHLGIQDYFYKVEKNLIQDYQFETFDIYEGEFDRIFMKPVLEAQS